MLTGMPRLVRLDLADSRVSLGALGGALGGGLGALRALQELNLTNVELEPLNVTLPLIGSIGSLRSAALLLLMARVSCSRKC